MAKLSAFVISVVLQQCIVIAISRKDSKNKSIPDLDYRILSSSHVSPSGFVCNAGSFVDTKHNRFRFSHLTLFSNLDRFRTVQNRLRQFVEHARCCPGDCWYQSMGWNDASWKLLPIPERNKNNLRPWLFTCWTFTWRSLPSCWCHILDITVCIQVLTREF